MMSAKEKIEANLSPPQVALRKYRSDWIAVSIFSCAINLLMLTGPLFMLQVYDRVLVSRSIPTLVALYILIVFLFGLFGLFSFYQFIGSSGLAAFFDLPWVPVFVFIVFLMHPWLGLLTVFGVVVITLFTLTNENMSNRKLSESSRWDLESNNFSETSRKNAEAIFSMGMVSNTLNYWKNLKTKSLGYAQGAIGISEVLMSMSQAIRLLLQSSILGLGCYKSFVMVRQAYKRLNIALWDAGDEPGVTQLPPPTGQLAVSNLVKLAPNKDEKSSIAILKGLNFQLHPGDGLGVIGSSASGKSSLARLLTGIWTPDRGTVRLDGATYDQWENCLSQGNLQITQISCSGRAQFQSRCGR